MASSELIYFENLHNRVREISTSNGLKVDDLELEFQKSYARYSRKFGVKEKDEFTNLLKRYWRRIIASGCDYLVEKRIKARKTKGQIFNDNLNELNRIRGDSEKDLDIDKYEELYGKLIDQSKSIDEKISIEKYEKKTFWNQIIIGFILGLISGFLVSMIPIYFPTVWNWIVSLILHHTRLGSIFNQTA